MTMPTANDVMIAGPAGRLSVRSKGLQDRPEQVCVLVQGANLCGQTGFDFGFPGGEAYSTLDALVEAGIGAVTFAIRGYERSDAPADPLSVDTEAGIADLQAVLDWVSAAGWSRPHLLGWSWGGRIVGRYTERRPQAVSRLVLLDPAIGGGDTIPHDGSPWWTNTREDFLKRVVPEFSDADAHAAFAEHVLRHDPRSPNGIRAENATGSVPIGPAAITRPTLMIYGSAAGRQTYMQGIAPRGAFLESLDTKDKALVIVPDAGDYGHLERPRRRFHAAIAHFLRSL
jgi:pimeloyl-ACP methyl ester carboxylesterase